MGIYLNPKNAGFTAAVNSEIYIDKSELIAYTNKVLGTQQRYICVSRPRRFGKTIGANMLSAYYCKTCDSYTLFQHLKIAENTTFEKYLNKYNVICLNMQQFLSQTHDVEKMKIMLEQLVLRELFREFPDIDYFDRNNLSLSLQEIFSETDEKFIFIIDEWDCIFRENKEDSNAQKYYLDFLRDLLKDKDYVELAYMTGILPIKKYGSHSALNMFDEFAMTNPKTLAEYVGFTEGEVRALCMRYNMDFDETARWYDGYQFKNSLHIYSPKSVVDAMLNRAFGSYWTQTETYEALKVYIEMNFDGLKDAIINMMAGERCSINTSTFTNDMTTFKSKDDVLTLLVHLGYLAYDEAEQQVFIPNYEISNEFVNAIRGAGWNAVLEAVQASETLLRATWAGDAALVGMALTQAHYETSILTYNNENSLACAISLAYYSARIFYAIYRELPAGKGYADLVFLPRPGYADKPAMIVELKWDKSVHGALDQIKSKAYINALKNYKGSVLLVAINYSKKTKKHECAIEEVILS